MNRAGSFFERISLRYDGIFMDNKKIVSIIIIAVSAALAVVSFILLPDTVIIQFSAGSSNVTTAPKALAVMIPTVLGIGGAAVFLALKGDQTTAGKALLISGVGLLVFVILLIVNLI